MLTPLSSIGSATISSTEPFTACSARISSTCEPLAVLPSHFTVICEVRFTHACARNAAGRACIPSAFWTSKVMVVMV